MYRMGIWQKATVYAIAALMSIGVNTADINKRGYVGFGRVAVAGEVHDKAFYDQLAKQAETIGCEKNPYKVINLLEKYKDDKENKSADFFNNLGVAYINSEKKIEGLNLLEYSFNIEENAISAWNLGVYSYKINKDISKSKFYFQKHIELNGNEKVRAKKYIDHFTKKGY